MGTFRTVAQDRAEALLAYVHSGHENLGSMSQGTVQIFSQEPSDLAEVLLQTSPLFSFDKKHPLFDMCFKFDAKQ